MRPKIWPYSAIDILTPLSDPIIAYFYLRICASRTHSPPRSWINGSTYIVFVRASVRIYIYIYTHTRARESASSVCIAYIRVCMMCAMRASQPRGKNSLRIFDCLYCKCYSSLASRVYSTANDVPVNPFQRVSFFARLSLLPPISPSLSLSLSLPLARAPTRPLFLSRTRFCLAICFCIVEFERSFLFIFAVFMSSLNTRNKISTGFIFGFVMDYSSNIFNEISRFVLLRPNKFLIRPNAFLKRFSHYHIFCFYASFINSFPYKHFCAVCAIYFLHHLFLRLPALLL